MGRHLKLLFTAVAIVVLAAALNILIRMFSDGRSWDLTSDKRYSLSEETISFLQKNKTPVFIRLYISKDLQNKDPELEAYALYLNKLLAEYKSESSGMIDLTVIETVPFSSSQAEAEKAGLWAFDSKEGKQYMYLGASFTAADGRTMEIPRFLPQRRSNVEGDITRILSVLTQKRRPVVGILSPYFKIADEKHPLSYSKDWPFVKYVQKTGFDIVSLSEESPFVPEGTDAVLVFYPVKLNVMAVYALDQYLMRGGNVIVMLDPFSEERFRGTDKYIPYDSGMQGLLRHAGVAHLDGVLTGDNVYSRPIVLDGKKVQYPFWLTITDKQMAKHPIMSGIEKLYLNQSGFLEYTPQEGLRETVLFQTSPDSGVMYAEAAADVTYENLLKNYQTTKNIYILALLLEGKFRSLYSQPIIRDVAYLSELPPFLSVPVAEGRLLVIGDSDLLVTSLWREKNENTGIYEADYLSDNMRFLLNMLDYMTTSGYAGVAGRKVTEKTRRLSEVMYNLAKEKYSDEKRQTVNDLIEIRQKIILLKEELSAANMVSVKKAKKMEQLKRLEIAKEENLRKIAYMTKETYQFYLNMLSFTLTVLLPLIFSILVWIIYKGYRCRVDRLAGRYINEHS